MRIYANYSTMIFSNDEFTIYFNITLKMKDVDVVFLLMTINFKINIIKCI